MIRAATSDDVDAAVDLLLAFRAEAVPGAHFERRACAATVRALIASRLGYAAVLDLGGPAGLFLAVAQPLTWSHGLAAREIVWFVRPGDRGRWPLRMLDGFEAWARSIGATHLALTDVGADMAALYGRRGYAPAERTWMKAV